MSYSINKSNGALLVTLHDREFDGPNTTSQPRQAISISPRLLLAGILPVPHQFTISGDYSNVFQNGLAIVLSDGITNDTPVNVTGSSYAGGFTTVTLSGALPGWLTTNWPDPAYAVLNAFVIYEDLTYRFIPTFAFDYTSSNILDTRVGTYTTTYSGLANNYTYIMCDEVIPDLGFAIDNGNIEYTCDQHTSLVLPGKGVQRYGEFQSENFVRLLEHFASNTSPTVPITGQLWYETTTGHECLRLYNGSSWTGNQDLDDGTLKFRDIKSAVSSDQDIVITANNTDDGLSISRTLALSAGKTIFAINRVDTTNLFRVEYNGTTYTSNSLTVDSNTNSFFYDKLIVNDTSVPSNQKSLSVNGDLLLYGSSSTGITLAISGTIRSDISVNSGGILKINYTSANGVTIGEGGGKLGVGIEPVAKLHVSSADSIQGRFEGSTDVGVELVSASSVVANYRYTGSKLYVSDTAAVTVLSNHASSRTIVGFGTDDATNKLQVFGNSKITGNLVMTGTITLAADPTLDLQVATKQYVDNATGATLDADLVAIAALAGTSGLLRKTAADTWSLDTTSYLSGTVGIGNGGTGQTTANDALNALLPSQSSNNGKVLQTNGTNASWVSVTGAPGGSDTQLQYNSSGSFAGATGLTTDGSSLTIGSTCTLNFGNFSTSGDAVAREYVARNTTTDATVTDLFLNGSSTRMVLANDSTWKFKIDIVARRTDADNESAAYTIEGCIDRNANAASTALVGSLLKTIVAEDTAAWDATAVADTTNGALVVQVTGEAAKTINWVAFIRTVEVIG